MFFQKRMNSFSMKLKANVLLGVFKRRKLSLYFIMDLFFPLLTKTEVLSKTGRT